jgi:hypothetical protein
MEASIVKIDTNKIVRELIGLMSGEECESCLAMIFPVRIMLAIHKALGKRKESIMKVTEYTIEIDKVAHGLISLMSEEERELCLTMVFPSRIMSEIYKVINERKEPMMKLMELTIYTDKIARGLRSLMSEEERELCLMMIFPARIMSALDKVLGEKFDSCMGELGTEIQETTTKEIEDHFHSLPPDHVSKITKDVGEIKHTYNKKRQEWINKVSEEICLRMSRVAKNTMAAGHKFAFQGE